METPVKIRFEVIRSRLVNKIDTLVVYAENKDEAEQIAKGSPEPLWPEANVDTLDVKFEVYESPVEEEKG